MDALGTRLFRRLEPNRIAILLLVAKFADSFIRTGIFGALSSDSVLARPRWRLDGILIEQSRYKPVQDFPKEGITSYYEADDWHSAFEQFPMLPAWRLYSRIQLHLQSHEVMSASSVVRT